MVNKIANLKIWQQIGMFGLVHFFSSVTFVFALLIGWNKYLLFVILLVLGITAFTIWTMALFRAKKERKYWFFIFSCVYWIILAGVTTFMSIDGVEMTMTALVLLGAFISPAIFWLFEALFPLIALGIGMTIWFAIKTIQEVKTEKETEK